MKIRLSLILFTLLCTTSFAQKYGVDLGYAYTFNRLKVVDEYPVYAYTETELKQRMFPNASIRPYIKIHKKLFFYFGADFVKYEFKHFLYFGGDHRNYKIHWILSETQVPVMLRMELARFKEKYKLSGYGGMFARFTGERKRGALADEGGGWSEPVSIKEERQRFTNFLLGVHQTFSFAKGMEGYADLQVKYMPGYYYSNANPLVAFLPFRVENKWAFSFTLGFSIFKPEREKTKSDNPSRLED